MEVIKLFQSCDETINFSYRLGCSQATVHYYNLQLQMPRIYIYTMLALNQRFQFHQP